jgi:hypothetical protein
MKTMYGIVQRSGRIPEDYIDKEVVEIYLHENSGLCLTMFGVVLATQRSNLDLFFERSIRQINMSKTVDEIKGLYGAEGILEGEPIKRIESKGGAGITRATHENRQAAKGYRHNKGHRHRQSVNNR